MHLSENDELLHKHLEDPAECKIDVHVPQTQNELIEVMMGTHDKRICLMS